jgi:hypothetical protein
MINVNDIQLDYNKLKLVLIADISGSMASMGDISVQLNETIQKQTGDVSIDFWTFNDHCTKVFSNRSSRDTIIEKKDVTPNGSTALYSSVANVIESTGSELSEINDVRPGRVAIVICTDGEENASTGKYNGEPGRLLVKQMIEHQQEKYNWTFFFLGANIDAISVGNSIGITRETCINYHSSSSGYTNAFRTTSDAIGRFKSTGVDTDRSKSLKTVAFKDEERDKCMSVEHNTQPRNTLRSSSLAAL